MDRLLKERAVWRALARRHIGGEMKEEIGEDVLQDLRSLGYLR